jgi:hypothetical protein
MKPSTYVRYFIYLMLNMAQTVLALLVVGAFVHLSVLSNFGLLIIGARALILTANTLEAHHTKRRSYDARSELEGRVPTPA